MFLPKILSVAKNFSVAQSRFARLRTAIRRAESFAARRERIQ
jgi:hypothetical protein